MSELNRTHIIRGFLSIMACVCILAASAQETVQLKGSIVDSLTNEPIPFVNISFVGKNIGTTSDLDGNFMLETKWGSKQLIFSAIGYYPKTIEINSDKKQNFVVPLSPKITELEEFVVQAKKDRYKNKDNPAVALMRNVVEHRDENRPKSFDYYQYDKYQKEEFDINNFTADWTKRKSFQSFQVLMDYVDTSDVNGKPFIPFLIKEQASTVYLRKDPEAVKEHIKGTQISGFEDSPFGDGIGQYLDKISANIDLYENRIDILDKSFTSPISASGPGIYKYYITDSTETPLGQLYQVQLMPRAKSMIAFTGSIWVHGKEGNYALSKAELRIDERINVNFLEDMLIVQEFEYSNDLGWVLIKDRTTVDIQPSSEGRGMFNTKTTIYSNFLVNQEKPDEFYQGLNQEVFIDSIDAKNDSFWVATRPDTLSEREAGIYEMADTIQRIPDFMLITRVGEFLVTGYIPKGKIDIGPMTSLFSYNDLEGGRFRVGGRTNLKFHENWRFKAYAAYGLKDERWKYSGTAEYYFSKTPRDRLHVSFTRDVFQPGFDVNWSDLDNIFLSLRRTDGDNMFYRDYTRLAYDKEWIPGMINSFEFQRTVWNSNPNAPFVYNGDVEPNDRQSISSNAVFLNVRIAKNEKILQGKFKRTSIKTTAPIFNVNLTMAPEFLDNYYEFYRIGFTAEKRFKFGFLGFTDTEFEAMKLFGKVPYPLLEIHRANETFTYDERSYNLMNFLEFASDEAIAFRFTHHFNGLLTSYLPLVDRLKWRAVCSGKFLLGNVSDQNLNTTDPDLLVPPENMNSLNAKVYSEVSVGVENIFHIFRLDVVKRLTYLDNPGIPNMFGVEGLALRGTMQFMF